METSALSETPREGRIPSKHGLWKKRSENRRQTGHTPVLPCFHGVESSFFSTFGASLLTPSTFGASVSTFSGAFSGSSVSTSDQKAGQFQKIQKSYFYGSIRFCHLIWSQRKHLKKWGKSLKNRSDFGSASVTVVSSAGSGFSGCFRVSASEVHRFHSKIPGSPSWNDL